MEENKSSIGSIVGTIIIIAVIIIGGLYFWGKRIEESKAKEDLIANQQVPPINTLPIETGTTSIKTVSPTDDLDSIEADLNNTNLNDLDAEVNPQLQ